MKQRFSSVDVKAIAHELNDCLTSLRVANIYDLSTKILLFKFAKPDLKKQIVIDTGFRCHVTEFARTTAGMPSAFVARLRKYLKTRRVTLVKQIGTDRILEFQFSDGQYRLFLEFFASGNIILTDAELKILALSRNVSGSEGQEIQRAGSLYCIENRQNFHGIPALSRDRVRDALRVASNKTSLSRDQGPLARSKPGADLRRCLAVYITELPPILIEHILDTNDFNASLKPAAILADDALLDELVQYLSQAREILSGVTKSTNCCGYIFAKRLSPEPGSTPESLRSDQPALLYNDFHPFIPKKFEDDPSIEILRFENYNKTVDEFYSSLEGQKLENKLAEREATAQRKITTAREDQAKKIEGLQTVQSEKSRKAEAIEANVERVQEAMDAVNNLIMQGMDWVDIGKLVEREQKKDNPVAKLIQLPLNLAENKITLVLAEEHEAETEGEDPFETDDSQSEAEGDEGAPENSVTQSNIVRVEILLDLSPWGNAREYYGQRKSAAVKEEKTHMQAEKAIRSTELKINEGLKKALKQEKAALQPIRNASWFEKFFWFISTDGYLILGGKDKSQDDLIYTKHLRKGDVFCHADVKDACAVVVKNDTNSPQSPIPPATLAQAGHLSICASEAWDSKAGVGAWWVQADQVSKFTALGELLPLGSFQVQGPKNFLPPGPLLLGVGIIFRISDESGAKRAKRRLSSAKIAEAAAYEGENQDIFRSVAVNLKETDTITSEKSINENSQPEESDGDEDDHGGFNPLQCFGQNNEKDYEKELASLELPTEQVAIRLSNMESQDDKNCSTQPLSSKIAVPQDTLSNTDTVETRELASHKDAAETTRRPKRGQKGKAKKMANKYKGQDEEDRIAAEALMGATAGRQKTQALAEAKLQREIELEEAKSRRRAQHERKQKAAAEHEEKRRLMLENADILKDEDGDNVICLETLVGTPKTGDEILEAITICAPWSALGKFKYKVKLQPGPLKKGKAVKEVLEHWKTDSGKKGAIDDKSEDTEKMWPREVSLIKALKPEEMINAVPAGRVRIMISGGAGSSSKAGASKGTGKSGKGKSKN